MPSMVPGSQSEASIGVHVELQTGRTAGGLSNWTVGNSTFIVLVPISSRFLRCLPVSPQSDVDLTEFSVMHCLGHQILSLVLVTSDSCFSRFSSQELVHER